MPKPILIDIRQMTPYTLTGSNQTYLFGVNSFINGGVQTAFTIAPVAEGNTLRVAGEIWSQTMGLEIAAENTTLQITESGEIRGELGILANNVDAGIVNRGTISSGSTGMQFRLANGSFVNHGEIGVGIDGTGVEQTGAGNMVVENYGLIHARGEGKGIDVGGTLNVIALGETSVIDAETGIYISTGAFDIINKGIIASSSGVAIDCGLTGGKIVNEGIILGDIAFTMGKNTFINAGRFEGTIFGGGGDDTYVVEGQIDIREQSFAGIDTVKSSGNFTLVEGLERLTLTGKKNVNATGYDADDVIKGNAGDNRITGGFGDDMLFGGAGRDIFVFNHFDEAETIADFRQGQDRIQIVGFDAYTSFGDLEFEKEGDDVRITFLEESTTDSILVKDQKIRDFDASDFQFA